MCAIGKGQGDGKPSPEFLRDLIKPKIPVFSS